MTNTQKELLPKANFWSITNDELLKQLHASENGLTEKQAKILFNRQTKKTLTAKPWQKDFILLLVQYKNPLVLLLVFAAILSLILGEYSDSAIVLTVLFFTGVFGFIQERNAGRAVEKLKELVHSKARVKRNNEEKYITIDKVVRGDIVRLSSGDIVPADCRILSSNDLHVNESALTGESFPSEKFAGECKPGVTLSQVTNSVFKGTNVINGSAVVIAVNTGNDTELGKITKSLENQGNETSFEKGINNFGYLLLRITIILTIAILVLNIVISKTLIDSLLFSLALAVGLTPELLPAIVTVTLSAGARRLASKKVIVKRLNAIQNLGQMNVLCADKTGTLTEGIVAISEAVYLDGTPSEKVLFYGCLNATFETGFFNVIDDALRKIKTDAINGYSKVDEVPYDFIRKRLSVVVSKNDRHLMITKGAVKNILDVCNQAETKDGKAVDINTVKDKIQNGFESHSSKGYRTIGIAFKDVTDDPVITKDDENDMCFLGFILLSDPPRQGIIDSIGKMRSLGISLKIISGDNQLVVKNLSQKIGVPASEIITGSQIHTMTSEALERNVRNVNVFAEIEPAQKEQIIRALQKAGNTVGYLGDGINDANALHAADVGISINNAADVAKEAADIVLMEKDINVIADGIKEGRKTFLNTMKYIFITTSANFGNMFSMAAASLLLPFLPLLPTQILLNNFLSDMPAITIASDQVDTEQITTPKKWDVKYIKRFMILFGLQSSLFDIVTFAILFYYFHLSAGQFRTGWFIESLLTEILILLVIRTQRPFFKSKPSKYLLIATSATFIVSIILPYLPFASIFQLQPLPPKVLLTIILIAFLYIVVAEIMKRYLMNKIKVLA